MNRRFTSWVALLGFLPTVLVPGVAQADTIVGDTWVSSPSIVVAQDEAPPAVGDAGIGGLGDVQQVPEITNPAPHVDDADTRPVPQVREITPEIVEDLPSVSDSGGDGSGTDSGGSSSSRDRSNDEPLGAPVGDDESINDKVAENVKPENEKYITALDWFAAHQDGAGYNWGGPKDVGQGGDCSGFMSQLAAVALGKDPWKRYFYTGDQAEVSKTLGLEIVPAGSPLNPGEFSYGWYNGGAGGGHTSGTLPSMVNVESGGSSVDGVSINKYGRNAVPSNDSQFYEGIAIIPWSHFEENKDRLKFGEISWEEADWRCTGSGAVGSDGSPGGDLPSEKAKGNC